jgi:uncharacterized protein (DUF488 family)
MLFTFGYQGLTLEHFIARLKDTGVNTIVDVRALPLSRKKGFSKHALASHLHAAGIRYVHMPALGCPKPIRNAYQADSDWPAYTRQYNAYLHTQAAAIQALIALASTSSACLICFEANFNRCHRSLIARLCHNQSGIPVTHITADTTIPEGSAEVLA